MWPFSDDCMHSDCTSVGGCLTVLNLTKKGMNSQGQALLTSPCLDWGICSMDVLYPLTGVDVWHRGERFGKGSNTELIFSPHQHLWANGDRRCIQTLKMYGSQVQRVYVAPEGIGHFFKLCPHVFFSGKQDFFYFVCVTSAPSIPREGDVLSKLYISVSFCKKKKKKSMRFL